MYEDEDERSAIRAARAVAHKDGDEGLIRDFQLAARIAREDGIVIAPDPFVWSRDTDFNSRKNAIYVQKLAEFEVEKGRKATALQVERIWNDAGISRQ